jgi:hypothetical protein
LYFRFCLSVVWLRAASVSEEYTTSFIREEDTFITAYITTRYLTTEVECIQFYNRENPEPRNNKETFCSLNNKYKPHEVLQIDVIRLLGKLIVTVVGDKVTNKLQRTHGCQEWNRKNI